MDIELIDIKEKDLEIIKDIYNYYIVNTTATFHTEKISIQELQETIFIAHPKYKSYLIKLNNAICGYCCLSQYKKRQAYDRTAEVTVYLKPGYTGKGIGKEVIRRLESIARQNDICVLIGIISGDNQVSIRMFEKCGYEKCAHFKQVGEKFNRIIDVVAYQKVLIK